MEEEDQDGESCERWRLFGVTGPMNLSLTSDCRCSGVSFLQLRASGQLQVKFWLLWSNLQNKIFKRITNMLICAFRLKNAFRVVASFICA